MSQLTSFTSSADSLINASSGTAGQVLAWDVASSSFIPQNPASGDTPELPLWTANTAYLSGDTVVTNLLAAVMLRKAGSATSSSTMDATELAGWRLFSQSDYPPFTATSLVCTGFIISQNGQLWRSITNRTTNTTFDATEQANWVALTGGGSTFQSAWLTGRLAASTNTNISNGDHAKFNTIRASAGSTISLDTATAYTSGVGSSVGRITLQAGGTYKLAGHLGDIGYASNSVSNYVTYSWFNADTGVEVGDKVTIASGWSSSNDWDGSGGIAEAIVAPSVNTRYELRILASSNLNSYGGGLAGGYATFNVVQLAGNLPAQNLSLTTTGSGAATYDNVTGALNIPTVNGLPNMTDLYVLRGQGTGVPVADSRLQFASGTTQTVDLVKTATNGLSVINSGSNLSLNVAGTAVGSGTNLDITTQAANGTDVAGGFLNLALGQSAGTSTSTIRMYGSVPSLTSGSTLNPTALMWQAYIDNGSNAIWESPNTSFNALIRAATGKNITLLTNGAGNIVLTPNGTGSVEIASGGGSNAINVGNLSKTTTIRGVLKRPGLSTVRFTRGTVAQNISANTQTNILWDGSANLGNTTACATVNTTTGVITFARNGFYRISGVLTLQSATANLAGGIGLITGTATISSSNIELWRLTGASNTPSPCFFSYFVEVTAVGTATIAVGSPSAFAIQPTSGTITAPIKSIVTIEEVG